MSEAFNMKRRRTARLVVGDSLWDHGSINMRQLDSISKDVLEKVSNGYRVLIHVNGASLASQYAKALRTKKKRALDLLARKASEINAMLLIMALRSRGVSTNVAPITKKSGLRESWQAIVMA